MTVDLYSTNANVYAHYIEVVYDLFCQVCVCVPLFGVPSHPTSPHPIRNPLVVGWGAPSHEKPTKALPTPLLLWTRMFHSPAKLRPPAPSPVEDSRVSVHNKAAPLLWVGVRVRELHFDLRFQPIAMVGGFDVDWGSPGATNWKACLVQAFHNEAFYFTSHAHRQK